MCEPTEENTEAGCAANQPVCRGEVENAEDVLRRAQVAAIQQRVEKALDDEMKAKVIKLCKKNGGHINDPTDWNRKCLVCGFYREVDYSY